MSSLLAFILGSLGMTIMAAGVVIFIIKYQNRVTVHAKEKENILAQHEIEILKASISGEEVERNRIAAELHDDIAASLAITKMMLYRSQQFVPDQEHLNKGIAILEESIDKIRALSTRMSHNLIEKKGLTDSITNYAKNLQLSQSIQVEMINQTNEIHLDVESQIHAFRIFQEFVNNTVKYAKPSTLTIHLFTKPNEIFSIYHNGAGIDSSEIDQIMANIPGNGLQNIHVRSKLIPATPRWERISNQEYLFDLSMEL
ncbi:MAG: hypothetical protein RL204_745 [Bacteroidota bacterium]|jgi:signal transduction histidine kinase